MIKHLIKLADHLDRKGLTKEADYVDALIRIAEEMPAQNPRVNQVQTANENKAIAGIRAMRVKQQQRIRSVYTKKYNDLLSEGNRNKQAGQGARSAAKQMFGKKEAIIQALERAFGIAQSTVSTIPISFKSVDFKAVKNMIMQDPQKLKKVQEGDDTDLGVLNLVGEYK